MLRLRKLLGSTETIGSCPLLEPLRLSVQHATKEPREGNCGRVRAKPSLSQECFPPRGQGLPCVFSARCYPPFVIPGNTQ